MHVAESSQGDANEKKQRTKTPQQQNCCRLRISYCNNLRRIGKKKSTSTRRPLLICCSTRRRVSLQPCYIPHGQHALGSTWVAIKPPKSNQWSPPLSLKKIGVCLHSAYIRCDIDTYEYIIYVHILYIPVQHLFYSHWIWIAPRTEIAPTSIIYLPNDFSSFPLSLPHTAVWYDQIINHGTNTRKKRQRWQKDKRHTPIYHILRIYI